MKVAIFISRFPPIWNGGTEIATMKLSQELVKKNVDTIVITSNSGKENEVETVNGARIFRLKVLKIKLYLQWPLYFIKILKILKKEKPDIIHVQAVALNAFFAFLIGFLYNIPYIVWARGSDINNTPFCFKFFLIRLILLKASKIIVLTAHMKKQIEILVNKEIIILPNSIEHNSDEEKLKEKIKFYSKNEAKLIFIGRIRKEKGLDYLIDAMDKIVDIYPKIILNIIGEGPYLKKINNKIKFFQLENNVKLIGGIPNEDIKRYLENSHIFILPSISEGFPMSILEAMSAGLPIVTTNIGGLPDIVEDGINGFIVKSENSQALTEAIKFLLENEDLMKKICKNNLNKANNIYSFDTTTSTLIDIYKSIIE